MYLQSLLPEAIHETKLVIASICFISHDTFLLQKFQLKALNCPGPFLTTCAFSGGVVWRRLPWWMEVALGWLWDRVAGMDHGNQRELDSLMEKDQSGWCVPFHLKILKKIMMICDMEIWFIWCMKCIETLHRILGLFKHVVLLGFFNAESFLRISSFEQFVHHLTMGKIGQSISLFKSLGNLAAKSISIKMLCKKWPNAVGLQIASPRFVCQLPCQLKLTPPIITAVPSLLALN